MITKEQYYKLPTESIDQYNARIAGLRAQETPVAPVTPYVPGTSTTSPTGFDVFGQPVAAGTPVTGSMITSSSPTPFVSPTTQISSPVNVPSAPVLGKQEQSASDLNAQIQRLNDQLVGKTDFVAQQRANLGMEQKISTQQSIYNQILNLKAQTENIPSQVEQSNSGRLVTATIQVRQQRELQVQAGIQANILNAQYNASTGDIAVAERQIQQAVNDKFGAIEEQRAAAIANLKLIQDSPEYDAETKARAAQQVDKINKQKAKDEQAKSTVADILKLSTSVSSSSIDDVNKASILNQITDLVNGDNGLNASTDTYISALKLAQPYMSDGTAQKEAFNYVGIANSEQLAEMSKAKSALEVAQIATKYGLKTQEQKQAEATLSATQALATQRVNSTATAQDTTTGSIPQDVQAILEGRNTLYNIRLTMGRNAQGAKYMQDLRNEIAQIDPKFDFVASDAGGKAVSSTYYQRSIAAIDSVLPNIDKVIQLSNDINRIGVKGVDALIQKGQLQINNKKVANLHEAQKLLSDEIGLALGQGTVSDMKLQLGFDVTDPSVSAEVFASNLNLVKEFVNNRKKGLQGLRYQSSTATNNLSGIGDLNNNILQSGASGQTSSGIKYTIE